MGEKNPPIAEYLQLIPEHTRMLSNVALNRVIVRSEPGCAETDSALFFQKGRVSNLAKEICGRCDARAACLELALRENESGIRAGLSEKSRKPLVNARYEYITRQQKNKKAS